MYLSLNMVVLLRRAFIKLGQLIIGGFIQNYRNCTKVILLRLKKGLKICIYKNVPRHCWRGRGTIPKVILLYYVVWVFSRFRGGRCLNWV